MTSPQTCTGVAATWCPQCGDCRCAGELNDPQCPLHGPDALHLIEGWAWHGVILEFVVLGDPIGQGQISCRNIRGKAIGTHTNGPALRAWRGHIASRAEHAMATSPYQFPVVGQPVAVDLVFTMRPPTTIDRAYPIIKSNTNPDTDHLERAVLDALSKVAIKDDALVLEVHKIKTYPQPQPGAHRLALDTPGVRIRILTMEQPPLRLETPASG